MPLLQTIVVAKGAYKLTKKIIKHVEEHNQEKKATSTTDTARKIANPSSISGAGVKVAAKVFVLAKDKVKDLKQERATKKEIGQAKKEEPLTWVVILETHALNIHNDARSQISSAVRHISQLTYSLLLQSYAQDYAYRLAHTGVFQHDPTNDNTTYALQGEKLFSRRTRQELTSRQLYELACRSWLDEAEAYRDGEVVGSQGWEKWGHYSAMIWPSTTEMGIAAARGKNGVNYVVARYFPPGNTLCKTPYKD